jgi:4-alpha-glucanotransferase
MSSPGVDRAEPRSSAPSRTAGVVIPLFSIRTRDDWGVGQIGDLPKCAAWVRRAGHRLLQILPPYELAAGETSPYGARTAFGLDPIYISVESIPDLDRGAIDEALGAEGRRDLERLRSEPRVEYAAVRALKMRVLRHGFERFLASEWKRGTARAGELAKWIDRERAWAEDLALYVALRESHGAWGWEKWPGEERHRVPHVMSRAQAALATPILEHHYLQWVAHTQWSRAREETSALGVQLMGDLPFVVCGESALVAGPPRRLARRTPRRLLAGRTGLGPARVRLGGDERGRPQVAPRADAPRGAHVRPLPARPRRRLLQDVCP